MSDGVPTPEQLARIQRGVMGRIDRRRAIGRGIAGTAVAVAVVGGGIGLLGPNLSFVGTSGGGSTGSAASSGDSAAGTAGTAVLCHTSSRRDSSVKRVLVDPAALPGAAIDACALVAFQDRSGRSPSAAEAAPSDAPATTSGGSTPLSASAAAVCRATDAVLQVYPLGGATAEERCARNGMTVVDG